MSAWDNQKVEIEKKETPKEIKSPPIFKSLKDIKQIRGIKVLSYGSFSSGKTHFALTGDAPVFVIDTENGTGPLADKFPDAQVINICEDVGGNMDEKDEVKNFENFIRVIEYLTTLPEDQIKTVVVDSISDIWEWSQAYAKTKIFKIPIENRFQQQWDWAVPTKLYLKQMMKLINKNLNVIFVARESETYAGAGQPTGKFEPKCQKKTPYFVDVVLHHQYKYIGGKGIVFQAKMNKCRFDGTKIGQVIEDPNFQKLKEMLIKK